MPPPERAPSIETLKLQRAILAPKVLTESELKAQVDASAELARAQNESLKEQLAELDKRIADAKQ